MDNDDDDDLSAQLNGEDLTAIEELTDGEIMDIDSANLSMSNTHWQKTALVISRAMYAYPDRFDAVPDVFYGQRVLVLVGKGLLTANGNVRRFRYSEVRLADSELKRS